MLLKKSYTAYLWNCDRKIQKHPVYLKKIVKKNLLRNKKMDKTIFVYLLKWSVHFKGATYYYNEKKYPSIFLRFMNYTRGSQFFFCVLLEIFIQSCSTKVYTLHPVYATEKTSRCSASIFNSGCTFWEPLDLTEYHLSVYSAVIFFLLFSKVICRLKNDVLLPKYWMKNVKKDMFFFPWKLWKNSF